MIIKSYFADSVEAAMAEASRQLGPDAMLLYSRESPPETRHLGRYEVVFSLAPEAPAPAVPRDETGARKAPRASTREEPDQMEQLAVELAHLRRQIQRMQRQMIAAGLEDKAMEGCPPVVKDLLEELAEAGLPLEFREAVLARLRHEQAETAPDEASVWHALQQELARLLPWVSASGVGEPGRSVIAFVGPPGAGKTLTLVKVAARFILKYRQPVQILSLDQHRVAAAEQLRTYAAILGAGFELVDPPLLLPKVLEQHRAKPLVLIDTPGLALKELPPANGLAEAIRACPQVEVHLTLTACMKTTDVERAVDGYRRFEPRKLVFTRMDETTTPATVLETAARTQWPLSFLGTGPWVPEDLLEATPQAITELLRAWLRAQPQRGLAATGTRAGQAAAA